MFFKLDFNKIELQVELKFYAYFATYLFIFFKFKCNSIAYDGFYLKIYIEINFEDIAFYT